ncbi:MAG: FKBP-type peptidyl-prolyl cis-trans isomerase [Candidatus Woesearchaeota archaeon]
MAEKKVAKNKNQKSKAKKTDDKKFLKKEKDEKLSKNIQGLNNQEKNANSKKIRIHRKTLYYAVGLVLLILAIVSGYFAVQNYFSEQRAGPGDEVAVWYTGRLESGRVFDTNVQDIAEQNEIIRQVYEPLKFEVGAGRMIKGFDEAVVGMTAGEKKTVEIKPEDAYGPYRAELVQTLTTFEFEDAVGIEVNETIVGMPIIGIIDGRQMQGEISKVGINFVSIDFNHELAGKKLIFDIELISIN